MHKSSGWQYKACSGGSPWRKSSKILCCCEALQVHWITLSFHLRTQESHTTHILRQETMTRLSLFFTIVIIPINTCDERLTRIIRCIYGELLMHTFHKRLHRLLGGAGVGNTFSSLAQDSSSAFLSLLE